MRRVGHATVCIVMAWPGFFLNLLPVDMRKLVAQFGRCHRAVREFNNLVVVSPAEVWTQRCAIIGRQCDAMNHPGASCTVFGTCCVPFRALQVCVPGPRDGQGLTKNECGCGLAAGCRKNPMERALGDAHAGSSFCLVQADKVAQTQCLHLIGAKDVGAFLHFRTLPLEPSIQRTSPCYLSSCHIVSTYDMNIYSFSWMYIHSGAPQ